MVRRTAAVLIGELRTSRRVQLGAGAATLLLAVYVLSPMAPAPGSQLDLRAGIYATAVVFFSSVVAIVAAGAPLARHSSLRLGVVSALSLTFAMGLVAVRVPIVPDYAKVAGAGLLGLVLARAVQQLWWLAAVGAITALADIWSVYSRRGVTRTVVEDHQEVLQFAGIVVPVAGFSYEDLVGASLVGMSDVVFAGFFLGTAYLWSLPLLRNAVAIAASIILTIVGVREIDALGGAVPAIPLMAFAVMVVNARAIVDSARSDHPQRRGRRTPP